MKRLFWLLDESAVMANPSTLLEMREYYRKIVSLIGKPDYEHIVVDPSFCVEKLAGYLPSFSPTVIIDLMGLVNSELMRVASQGLRRFFSMGCR